MEKPKQKLFHFTLPPCEETKFEQTTNQLVNTNARKKLDASYLLRQINQKIKILDM